MVKNKEMIIDVRGLHYHELNTRIRHFLDKSNPDTNTVRENGQAACRNEIATVILKNVEGQRYIGDGLKGDLKINIHGTPGNDMAAFMDGPIIEVFGNGQDGIANTMNSGKIIIHGDSGDIMGYSMRGGEIYIRGSVGWRSGIHMKSYLEKFPVIVIGGKTGNFLGEYMAGGIIIVLGLGPDNPEPNLNCRKNRSFYFEKFYSSLKDSIAGDFVGTGMHGGTIFLRADIEEFRTGKEVKKMHLDAHDISIIGSYIKNFCAYFNRDYSEIISQNFKDFIKLTPYSHRPYGKLYVY